MYIIAENIFQTKIFSKITIKIVVKLKNIVAFVLSFEIIGRTRSDYLDSHRLKSKE